MARFGFCAGTYQSTSDNVDAQRCWNWYPEVVESGDGVSGIALYPTPGLRQFAYLTGSSVRGLYEYNGRCFAVSDRFYEIFADGSFTGYDTIPNDGLPVTMAANNVNQLMICGGGQLWLFPLVQIKTASLVSVQFFPSHPIGVSRGPSYSRSSFQATLSSNPFAVGDTVYFSSVAGVPGLNGLSLIINYINGNTIQGAAGTSLGVAPAALTSTTGQVSTAATGQITTGLAGTPYMVDFMDGYFVLLLKDSTMFQTSNLEDGSTWDPSFIYQTNEYAGNAVTMISNFREFWVFGSKKALPYYDSGDLLTPMQPVPGAFVEHGCNAPWSVARLDNSIFWLGSDERGRNVAWRSQGYTPVRVSNHGVEAIWQSYPTLSDCIAYTTSKKGHGWWHLYFPSVGHSWRYDTTTGMWHEVGTLHPNGSFTNHRSRIHVYAFEKNLVGDTSTGMVYELSDTAVTDDLPDLPQNPIRRARRAPHVINEHEWIFHHRLRVLLEAGLGPTPPLLDGEGQPREPQVMLRWSDDGGHTWSMEYLCGAGFAGQFRRRVEWRRLGRSRDRIYEISTTDPIPWRLVDAYLDATDLAGRGYKPQQRYVHEIGKMA